MAHELKLAAFLLVALVVATVIMVAGVTFTIRRVNRGFVAGSCLVQRAKLLARADSADLAPSLLVGIEELTTRMLGEVTSEHMKTAVKRELESIYMAKLALERGDPDRARDYLGRVGRRMVRFEF
jgi:hypothetical protein